VNVENSIILFVFQNSNIRGLGKTFQQNGFEMWIRSRPELPPFNEPFPFLYLNDNVSKNRYFNYNSQFKLEPIT